MSRNTKMTIFGACDHGVRFAEDCNICNPDPSDLELKLEDELKKAQHQIIVLRNALLGIIEIGKRDLTNPKYDGYFETAREAIVETRGIEE